MHFSLISVDMLTFLTFFFFLHLLIKMITLLFLDGLKSNAARTQCLFRQGEDNVDVQRYHLFLM